MQTRPDDPDSQKVDLLVQYWSFPRVSRLEFVLLPEDEQVEIAATRLDPELLAFSTALAIKDVNTGGRSMPVLSVVLHFAELLYAAHTEPTRVRAKQLWKKKNKANTPPPAPSLAQVRDCVRVCLQCGANPNGQDEELGVPFLWHASLLPLDMAFDVLVAAGADPRYRAPGGETGLHFAMRHGAYDAVLRWIDKHGLSVTRRDAFGRTPLHWACNGHREIPEPERLLRAVASRKPAALDQGDKIGERPLHAACQNRHRRTVACLIQLKANVNVLSRGRTAPLTHAIEAGDMDLCRLLVAAGACVHPVVTVTRERQPVFRSLERHAVAHGHTGALAEWLLDIQTQPEQAEYEQHGFRCATCGLDSIREMDRMSKYNIFEATSLAEVVDRCANPNCTTPSCTVPLISDQKAGAAQVVCARLKRCGGCRQVSYCSVACQRSHWPVHQTDCRAKTALTSPKNTRTSVSSLGVDARH